MDTSVTSNGPQPPPRRYQFSLWYVFALMLSICMFLALVMQLRHIGFVAFCFLVGMGAGWSLRRQRLLAAATTALLVFVVTYFACWARMGYPAYMNVYQYQSRVIMDLQAIADELSQYHSDHGEYPESLLQLGRLHSREIRFDDVGNPVDLWHHPIHYRRVENHFELTSFGNDGKPGGFGLNADTSSDDNLGRSVERIAIWHFLFETDGSIGVFWAAVVGSISAGVIWYAAQRKNELSTKWLVTGIVATTVTAVVIAVFLAAIYVSVALTIFDDHH